MEVDVVLNDELDIVGRGFFGLRMTASPGAELLFDTVERPLQEWSLTFVKLLPGHIDFVCKLGRLIVGQRLPFRVRNPSGFIGIDTFVGSVDIFGLGFGLGLDFPVTCQESDHWHQGSYDTEYPEPVRDCNFQKFLDLIHGQSPVLVNLVGESDVSLSRLPERHRQL